MPWSALLEGLLDATGILRPFKLLFWGAFAVFVVCSVLTHKPEGKADPAAGPTWLDPGTRFPDPIPFAPPAGATTAPPIVTDP